MPSPLYDIALADLRRAVAQHGREITFVAASLTRPAVISPLQTSKNHGVGGWLPDEGVSARLPAEDLPDPLPLGVLIALDGKNYRLNSTTLDQINIGATLELIAA